jgi:hypothetical protein
LQDANLSFTLSFVTEDEGDEINYSKEMCEDLAKHLMHVKSIPQECMKFSDVVHSVKVNEKDSAHPTSWMS